MAEQGFNFPREKPYPKDKYRPTLRNRGLWIEGDDDITWLYEWNHALVEYLRLQEERVDELEKEVATLTDALTRVLSNSLRN